MNTQLVEEMKLSSGSHKSIEDGACVMELVSYMANEPWSDRPQCTSRVLTSFAISLNDRFNDEDRQLLKPLLPKLIGTRNGKDKERSDYLVLQSITVFLPLLTEGLGLVEVTERLRGFKIGEWDQARDYINSQRSTIRNAAAAYAADAAAYAADAAAAYAADAAAYAAAYAADAAAYAADAAADAGKSVFWRVVKEAIVVAAVKALEHACNI